MERRKKPKEDTLNERALKDSVIVRKILIGK